MHTLGVVVKTACQSRQALERGVVPQLVSCSPLYGGGAGGHSWSMLWLFLRGLPLQAGFSIIDAVSKPAL